MRPLLVPLSAALAATITLISGAAVAQEARPMYGVESIPQRLVVDQIIGQVVDAAGAPLARVKVKAGKQRTTTDAQGQFSLPCPGSCTVVLKGKGLKKQERELAADGSVVRVVMERR